MENDAVVPPEILHGLFGRRVTQTTLWVAPHGPHLDLTRGKFLVASMPAPRNPRGRRDSSQPPAIYLPPNWGMIPGAEGSVAVCNALDDLRKPLAAKGVEVVVLCSDLDFSAWGHFGWQLLKPSDDIGFVRALDIPTFQAGERHFERRMTLAISDGVIIGGRSSGTPVEIMRDLDIHGIFGAEG